MKKFVALLMAALLVFALAACSKPEETKAPTDASSEAPTESQTEEPTEPAVDETKVLEDETHAAWVAHGQFLLEDGTENGWNGKDTELYEASALKAISFEELKAIDEDVYNTLKEKDVKYLYTTNLVFGTNKVDWSSNFLKDGQLYKANGSYCFKVAQCTVDVDGDNKVYAEDQWISDPKTAYVEALTPDTVFYPTWQEEKDENGFAWDKNPVVIGGAGLYTLVMAQYNTVSAAGNPGYGAALIKKEEKEGVDYEVIETFVPADHTYGIVGSFEGSNWGEGADVEMTTEDNLVWTGTVELKAENEWKVRADGAWDNSWGQEDGSNFKAEADGTYEVTIDFSGDAPVVSFEAK